MPRKSHWSSSDWLAFAGFWLAGALFYWWLVAKTEKQQLAAAALAALPVAFGLVLLLRHSEVSFGVRPAWLARLAWRLPPQIARDVGLLAVALWRAIIRRRNGTGVVKPLPFDAGADDPRSVARRALVIAAISTPPNSIALRVERDALWIHQLVSREQPVPDRKLPV